MIAWIASRALSQLRVSREISSSWGSIVPLQWRGQRQRRDSSSVEFLGRCVRKNLEAVRHPKGRIEAVRAENGHRWWNSEGLKFETSRERTEGNLGQLRIPEKRNRTKSRACKETVTAEKSDRLRKTDGFAAGRQMCSHCHPLLTCFGSQRQLPSSPQYRKKVRQTDSFVAGQTPVQLTIAMRTT
jgi:hypothetical protein